MLLRSLFPLMLQIFSTRRAFKGHLGTQGTLLGHFGTQSTWTLKHLRYYGMQRALEQLGNRALKPLGNSKEIWALGTLKGHLDTQTLGHLRHSRPFI